MGSVGEHSISLLVQSIKLPFISYLLFALFVSAPGLLLTVVQRFQLEPTLGNHVVAGPVGEQFNLLEVICVDGGRCFRPEGLAGVDKLGQAFGAVDHYVYPIRVLGVELWGLLLKHIVLTVLSLRFMNSILR